MLLQGLSAEVQERIERNRRLAMEKRAKKLGGPIPSSSQQGQGTNHCSWLVAWLLGGLTSHQHASVSWGRICSDNLMCCHTEIEAADQTFHLTQSQYTDTGRASPSTDPITPGAWQSSHWSANF